jgi:glycosyltransferase involved in cell wall biosynthesis
MSPSISWAADLAPVVVIPAYQPGAGLPRLAADLQSRGLPSVLVVDDGSSEDKAPIFEELRQTSGVVVLSHAVNLGKGAALKTAFNHILLHDLGRPGVVTADADGQHLPGDVLRVAQALQENPAALILGTRDFAGKVPLRSALGNLLTARVFRFLLGRTLGDTQTGLRGIPASLLRDLLVLTTTRYEFELDMLITAVRKGTPLVEIPITTIYEDRNRGSHFNPLLDSFRIYFVFLRFLFGSLLTYCTDVVTFTVAYRLTGNILESMTIGRAVAAVVSVLLSRNFVFKAKRSLLVVAANVFLLWLFLLGASYGLIRLFVDHWGWNVYLSRIVADTGLFLVNFLVQRDLIFGAREERAET